ncbi:hypothetical protein P8V03_01060 [Clostridium sp. A1-XYC3]|uniref:Uncharacterized protein n=1 Tax=Clostridium tanneri TaxID=3037988 RepID=A0ABU4JNM1_9CLOT|nr:hypothetical protein [Clostridium sp. A1-XYC3]MDW8799741.1 hypothetical protein [Clostridium sp. A1-XYC3]
MTYIVIQYVFVVLLVVGVGYLLYLLKEKGHKFNEDYFGITHSILNSLGQEERTPDNVKSILRLVSKAVTYVEDNYKNEDNAIKEDKALQLAKEAMTELNFRRVIDDDNIRCIIRIAAALLTKKE